MGDATIATIVPFYNRRHTILTALASVADQTVPPGPIIAVDDGSTDGGAAAVRHWIQTLRGRIDCRLVVQTNRGVSAARNRGLTLAGHCDYVAFLDSDDVWPPDFLKRTSAALTANALAVAATCDRRFVFADGAPSRSYDSAGIIRQPAIWMMENGANIASATLFRRATLLQRGGFDPALRTGEDSALFMPLSLDGPWLHAPGAPVTYRSGVAESLGDEGNLSFRYRGNRRLWARIYEDFFVHGGGHGLQSDRRCRRLLSRAWYDAGCELVEQNAAAEAILCYGKAVRWNPWRARYYRHTLRACLKSLGRHVTLRRQTAGHASPADCPAVLAR